MELSIPNYMFSETEFLSAKRILEDFDPEYFDDSDYFSPPLDSQSLDRTFQGSLVQKPNFKNCTFNGTQFDGNNAVESNILSCAFFDVIFRDVCMNYSNLTSTKFVSSTFDNCGCSTCDFSKVRISKSELTGCDFIRSYFNDVEVSETTFIHCSFEEAEIHNTAFVDVDLSQTGFDYASLDSVRFVRTTLPFWGVLRSFGGLNALCNSEDVQIKFSASSKAISVSELLSKMASLQAYFYKKKQYFVLANVCIFLGQQKNALAYIMEGLRESIQNRDFRTIRHLCELASKNCFFKKRQLRQLYDILISESATSGMSHHEYQLYLTEIQEIRRLLVENPYELPRMTITIQTKFSCDDYTSLASLLKFIDTSLQHYLPQCIYHISIYRNSPPQLEISICEVINQLFPYLLAIGTIVFGKTNKSVKFIQDINTAIGSGLDNKEKRIHLKEAKKQEMLKTEHMQLENEKLKLEIEEKALGLQEKLQFNQSQSFLMKEQELLSLPSEVKAQIPCIKYSFQGGNYSLSIPRQGVLLDEKNSKGGE